MDRLDDACLLRVFSFCDLTTISSCTCACSRWSRLASSEQLLSSKLSSLLWARIAPRSPTQVWTCAIMMMVGRSTRKGQACALRCSAQGEEGDVAAAVAAQQRRWAQATLRDLAQQAARRPHGSGATALPFLAVGTDAGCDTPTAEFWANNLFEASARGSVFCTSALAQPGANAHVVGLLRPPRPRHSASHGAAQASSSSSAAPAASSSSSAHAAASPFSEGLAGVEEEEGRDEEDDGEEEGARDDQADADARNVRRMRELLTRYCTYPAAFLLRPVALAALQMGTLPHLSPACLAAARARLELCSTKGEPPCGGQSWWGLPVQPKAPPSMGRGALQLTAQCGSLAAARRRSAGGPLHDGLQPPVAGRRVGAQPAARRQHRGGHPPGALALCLWSGAAAGKRASLRVLDVVHLFGRVGGVGAQLPPEVSDVSQRNGTRGVTSACLRLIMRQGAKVGRGANPWAWWWWLRRCTAWRGPCGTAWRPSRTSLSSPPWTPTRDACWWTAARWRTPAACCAGS